MVCVYILYYYHMYYHYTLQVWLDEEEGLKLKLRLERCHIIKRKTKSKIYTQYCSIV